MRIAARVVLGSLFVAILACAAEDELPDATSQRSGNDEITARASLLFEPPTIALGDVTTAVILVTTPPGRRVLPLTLPEIPGVWLLESLVDPTEKGSRRWLHKTFSAGPSVRWVTWTATESPIWPSVRMGIIPGGIDAVPCMYCSWCFR